MDIAMETNGVTDDKMTTSESNAIPEDSDFMVDPIQYVTLPIQNERIWRKYQISLDRFWTVSEVNIDKDRASMLETFSQEQCQYLQRLVGFMTLTHNTFIETELFLDLINQVGIKEASYYFSSQAESKKTHSMMYSLLIDELTGDLEKRAQIMTDVARMPEVHNALMWYVERVTQEKESFAKRMLTFATLQGIIFTVPFILFSWVENNHPSKLSGLTKSNQLIWRDEKLYLSLSCMLLAEIEDEVSSEEAVSIVQTAVQHAKNIFTNALPVSALGIDVNLMSQFIEHCADVLLSDTINKKIFHAETPFDWIVEPKVDMNEAALTNVITTTAATSGAATFGFDDDF